MDKPVGIPSPPQAQQRPYSYERHGVTIEDPWHWLRDPKYPEVDDPDVLAYLKAENAYFDGWKAQHQGLLDQLFEEMKGRIKEDDSSVPLRDGDYLYWWAFTPGAQYRTWYRKPRWRRRRADLRRAGRGRGQGLFPARARSRSALTASCSRRWSTITDRSGSSCASATSRPARTSRPSPSRHRPAGVDQRQRRDRLHRGQRPLAQLSRALSPARRAGR